MSACIIMLDLSPRLISHKVVHVVIRPRRLQFAHFQKAMQHIKSTFPTSRHFGRRNRAAMFQILTAAKKRNKLKVFGTRLEQHMSWPTFNKYSGTTSSVL